MTDPITIDARWDGNAGVWLATSADVPGLVLEADTWPALVEEARLVLPDLLELNGQSGGDTNLSIVFKAEERFNLAPL